MSDGDHPRIDWTLSGPMNSVVGANPTMAERCMSYGVAVLAPVVLYFAVWSDPDLDWRWWQVLIAAGLAFDIAGGVLSTTTNSGKRFIYAPPLPGETGSRLKQRARPYMFAVTHFHCLAIPLLYGGSWVYGAFWYAFPVMAALLIYRLPLYLSRPVAFTFLLATVVLNSYVIEAPAGMEWLAPFIYTKLVCGFCVREEPYRP